MQFAKLFTFPTGQLLVERELTAIGSDGAFSSLTVTTKYQPEGKPAVKAVSKTVYPTAQSCEQDFEAFSEQQARHLFAAHQDYLRQGLEISFATDCKTPIERPTLRERMLGKSTQQEPTA